LRDQPLKTYGDQIAVKRSNWLSKQSSIRLPYQPSSDGSTGDSVTKIDLLKSQPSELLTNASKLRSGGEFNRGESLAFIYSVIHFNIILIHDNKQTNKGATS
jgi:predicted phage gp36 major capsid-like protein